MSKNPLAAKAAIPYARALYDFSVEQNLMHQITADFQNLEVFLTQTSDLTDYLNNPLIGHNQKQELLDNIIKLDNNTKEIIYVLIQYYNTDVDSNKDSNVIPYNAIQKSTENKELFDLSWSLTDIPIPLRQMLYKFITLHMQKKEEEVKRDF